MKGQLAGSRLSSIPVRNVLSKYSLAESSTSSMGLHCGIICLGMGLLKQHLFVLRRLYPHLWLVQGILLAFATHYRLRWGTTWLFFISTSFQFCQRGLHEPFFDLAYCWIKPSSGNRSNLEYVEVTYRATVNRPFSTTRFAWRLSHPRTACPLHFRNVTFFFNTGRSLCFHLPFVVTS